MSDPTTPTAPDAAAPDALAAVMVRVTIDGGEMLYLIAQPCPQADGATRWSVEGCGSHTTPRGAALMACVSRKLAAVEVYVPGQHSPAAGAHAAEVERLTDALARLRAPAADLAAIGARAAAYTAACDALALVIDDDRIAATGEHDAAFARRDDAAQASAADIPTLLAWIASEPARVAAAVAAEREACAAACRDVASDAADDDPVSETADACAEAIDARAARS